MADSAQDRKLPASQRKLDKARAKGQVARSRDLGHFAAITGTVLLLVALAPQLSAWLGRLMAQGLSFDATSLADPASMGTRLGAVALPMLGVLLPVCGTLLLLAIAAGVLCGGWNFTLEPLAPDFSKINPLSGIKRLVSLHQLTDTLKACVLALVLAAAASLYLKQHWTRHAELLAMPLPAALAAGVSLLQGGLVLMCGVLAVFALVDVPLQKQMHAKRQRMSLQEMKQEMKEVDGNAETKARMKTRMRELANRRMLAAVPLADLVVMNPSHYAVALKYDEHKMAAPRVVAKGAELLALKIRDLAREAKVPVLQSPPLARALYAHTEVDQEVPARLFAAVAQVLAWVYQLRDAMAAGSYAYADAPVPVVPADMDPLHEASGSAADPGRENES